MKATFENVKALAVKFLAVADELNESVSAYFNGSNDVKDVNAYYTVKAADKAFIDAINSYYGENDYTYGLNYELAESVIY